MFLPIKVMDEPAVAINLIQFYFHYLTKRTGSHKIHHSVFPVADLMLGDAVD